ncbi:hypothetical protein ATCVMO0605SPH_109L [Acanthocystis turfacea Chlorella virus MO0605SPH]|nr:hypothetical protein ATCVMO0605SPH_109L [Acanthocystis turfacea Chlorella virus MO0605SPH]AGE59988.1 hypothetical protein ATCVWI0606_109L [Acanthocystis turfacea Chlorella virus WI0606]
MTSAFVKKFIDLKQQRGAQVYTIGVNLPEGFASYRRLVNISPPLCRFNITNTTLQNELCASPYVRTFPEKVDIAVLGTHEDYFTSHFGRLFSENVPYVVCPKELHDKYGYVFNKSYYEDVYDDGFYIIMKLVKNIL